MTLLVAAAVMVLLALAVGYGIRCVVSPFTTRGRRRFPIWLRSWWHGEQAENRDDSWT